MNTDQKLSKLDEFLHDISREPNAELGGEAGYYVFSYDPKDEMRVRQWTKDEIKLLQQAHRPVIEFDLYKVVTKLLVEKYSKQEYENLEMRTGSMTRVVNAANSVLHIGQAGDLVLEYIVESIEQQNVDAQHDPVILLTGVGKCYPLLRSHKILNDLHDRLAQGIVLMMFPGRYEDGYLYLFGDVKDGNNYRAKPI